MSAGARGAGAALPIAVLGFPKVPGLATGDFCEAFSIIGARGAAGGRAALTGALGALDAAPAALISGTTSGAGTAGRDGGAFCCIGGSAAELNACTPEVAGAACAFISVASRFHNKANAALAVTAALASPSPITVTRTPVSRGFTGEVDASPAKGAAASGRMVLAGAEGGPLGRISLARGSDGEDPGDKLREGTAGFCEILAGAAPADDTRCGTAMPKTSPSAIAAADAVA